MLVLLRGISSFVKNLLFSFFHFGKSKWDTCKIARGNAAFPEGHSRACLRVFTNNPIFQFCKPNVNAFCTKKTFASTEQPRDEMLFLLQRLWVHLDNHLEFGQLGTGSRVDRSHVKRTSIWEGEACPSPDWAGLPWRKRLRKHWVGGALLELSRCVEGPVFSESFAES